MTSEEMLAMLNDSPGGSSDLEIGEHTESAPQVEKSPTALKLDDWSMRRGQEVLEASERLKQTFELGDAAKDKHTDAALATADFHAAAFEPEPQLAQACKNDRIRQYMQNLMETPEFQALHAETQLDETASEIATVSFAEQWVKLAATDQPEDDFKAKMQALGAAAKALTTAQQDVGDLRDAQSAMGLGNGTPGAPLAGAALASMFKRVRSSEMLKKICERAGRYRRMAQAQQRKKTLHGQDDMVGVVLDGEIGRLLPQELSALDDPDLEMDVMRRIIERQAMCRDYRGIESKARGPIVVVVDESGSMSGERIYTAKAMALAMMWVAHHQKRWVALVGFSGDAEGTYLAIPPNKPKPDELMEWLEHFYGGGTVCDVPLVELPKNWVALGCPKGKTDIIIITDACLGVPDEIRDSFLSWKQATQAKVVTLVLGAEAGALAAVSDRTHSVSSLSLKEDAVQEVLGT